MNATDGGRAQTTVGHLKAFVITDSTNRVPDSSTLRLRIDNVLNRADPYLPDLPSGAILLVRKLLHPTPLSQSSRSKQAEWIEQLRSHMRRLYVNAVRPTHSIIPPNASSILFNDTGEMLVYLTRDLLTGQARQRWYWQPLLRNIPDPTHTALATIWNTHASYIPIVLGSLTRREVLAIIQQFSSAEIQAIAQALHTSFDLPISLRTLIVDLARSKGEIANIRSEMQSPSAQVEAQQTAKEAISTSSHAFGNDIAPVPPWHPWLSQSETIGLTPQAHCLLGLGLALYHAPTFARSTRFANQATNWMHHVLAEPIVQRDSPSPIAKQTTIAESREAITPNAEQQPLYIPNESKPILDHTIQAREQTQHATISIDQTNKTIIEVSKATAITENMPLPASNSVSAISASDDVSTTVISNQVSTTTNSGHVPTTSISNHDSTTTNSDHVPTTLDSGEAPPTQEFVFGATQPFPTDGIPTELGGVLYLINLLAWLNLPGEWDEDGTFSEQMSGWSIIETLARGLLGMIHAFYIPDPLWNLIAQLDQRQPGEPVGTGIATSQALSLTPFRLPPQWLLRYGPKEANWLAAIEAEHLLLFDETAGYLIADVPLQGRSDEYAILEEIEHYCAQGIDVRWHRGEVLLREPLHPSITPFLSEFALWWLERVIGFVYALLARALDATEEEIAIPALLCKPGQLIASRTHIDLRMSMEQISLASRRCGLDRDPGWVPDLARIVLFHFE